MIFIWGKKHVYRKMGFVFDFCPLCRKGRPFRLDRIGLAGHIYYVSVGSGKLMGYGRTCMVCKTVLNANPDSYREVSKKVLEPAALQRLTFPNFETSYADRLALEQKVMHSPASVPSDVRLELMKEPFVLLSPAVEKRFSSTHIDKQTGLTALGALLLFPTIAEALAGAMPDFRQEIFIGVVAIGVTAVAIQGSLQSRRFFEKKVFPVLVPALRPLRPTQEEIASILGELKSAKTRLGRKLKLQSLWEKLRRS